MAEALKTFREGEDILASETNENNQFLLSKLSDNAAQVQSYVEGEVATIKSNVASVQATLQENIDALSAKIKIYIIKTYENGDSGYIIWSNGYCEQWGWYTATGDYAGWVGLHKPFKNANYFVTAQFMGGYQRNLGDYNYSNEGPAITDRTADGFNVRTWKGWNGLWKACGYLRAGSY
jgi:hypothetical protein